jgi:NAD(P)-dependent dehydrogenase (short-subunit alcohol dehydrogenase family)
VTDVRRGEASASPAGGPEGPPLRGRVAVVAGATRGAGRGIARMLGEAGATVYCSGRSVSGHPATGTRPETIDETADLVTAAGGRGIAVQTDHLQADQVERLFARVKGEAGRLDVLVNDIWGGDHLTEWGTRFWKLDPAKGFAILDSAVRTHILTSRYGVPLMIEQRSGLVVEITDGDHGGYRGTLYYDLAKTAAIRLAFDMAQDLEGTGVTAVAVTPGFLRSEAMLERFGVTEATWRQAKVMGFEASETPCFVGRAVAALAADPNVHHKAGGAYASWTLSDEYGFTDIDGGRPHWERYMLGKTNEILDRGGPAGPQEQFWIKTVYGLFKTDARYREMAARVEAVVGVPASDYDPRGA